MTWGFNDADPVRSLTSGLQPHLCRFVGGSAAVTETHGDGITVSYVSSGIVELTWAVNPGTFVGCTGTFQATTPADVKSYVLVPGAYNSTTRKLRLNMYESGTLTDLAALEWLTVIVWFRRPLGEA